MAKLILVDSNVYIRLLRSGMDPSSELERRHDVSNLATCGIIEAEVLRGLRFPKSRRRMADFFDLLHRIPTPSALWDEVAELAWSMDRKGQVIPLTDLVIAACALRVNAAVLTNDQHFQLIPDLRVIGD